MTELYHFFEHMSSIIQLIYGKIEIIK